MVKAGLSAWRRHLALDVVLGALASFTLSRMLELTGDGSTLYQVVGGSAIGLVAFVVTPVATLLTLTGGRRSRAFDRRHRATIIRAMTWAFATSIGLLILAVIGGASDDPMNPATGFRWLTLGAAVSAMLSVVRLFWFFVASLSVRDADEDAPIDLVAKV